PGPGGSRATLSSHACAEERGDGPVPRARDHIAIPGLVAGASARAISAQSMSAPRGAIVVHQVSRVGQIGPLAPWITMAGWAQGAEQRYGQAWLVTTEGVLSPTHALEQASRPTRAAASVPGWRRRLPEPLVTAVKDLRSFRRARRFRRSIDPGRWQD